MPVCEVCNDLGKIATAVRDGEQRIVARLDPCPACVEAAPLDPGSLDSFSAAASTWGDADEDTRWLDDKTVHRCASPECPGFPWKASESPHPCPPGVPDDPWIVRAQALEAFADVVSEWSTQVGQQAAEALTASVYLGAWSDTFAEFAGEIRGRAGGCRLVAAQVARERGQ